MSLVEEEFPLQMRNLPEEIRSKAAEIANVLQAEGMAKSRAWSLAIKKAKEWASFQVEFRDEKEEEE